MPNIPRFHRGAVLLALVIVLLTACARLLPSPSPSPSPSASPSASPSPDTAAPSRSEAPASTATPVNLFFLSNRAAEPESGKFFSGARGEVAYGLATVGIPAHHLIGRHEEPSLLKFEWTRDANKHISLRDVKTMSKDEMLLQLSIALDASPGGKVMIFVPGYNADFVGATLVVGQFVADLKFGGPVVLFSWPSHGRTASYVPDETNAEWAAEDFVKLLKMMLDEVPAESIYLVGHSMGNRILGRGITTFASDRPDTDFSVIREIVMIAPDIDADVFRMEIAPRIARTGVHTTLYASSNDRALKASKLFHGYARAGDAGDGLVVVDGVETIDASDIGGGLLGHSYFSEDHRIMEDIFALLQSGQRADNRFNLRAVDVDGKRHWAFRK